jgi:hypothetical protein
VSLMPPELTRPFASNADRDAARERLDRRDRTLRTIEALIDKPPDAWSQTEVAAFPSAINGVEDPPPQRIRRWGALFADELAEVHLLVSSPRSLSDIELQEVLYLAGRLLATVSGWSIADVDEFAIK